MKLTVNLTNFVNLIVAIGKFSFLKMHIDSQRLECLQATSRKCQGHMTTSLHHCHGIEIQRVKISKLCQSKLADVARAAIN